ncbi:MAG: Ig-like domain-containing protein [Patescibacteria group bacterium]
MFLQFSGLSLLIHLLIILSAKAYNAVRGRSVIDSAFQTHNKKGGVVRGVLLNRIISFLILIFICTYMFTLAGIAVMTASSMGADEPQVIAYKELGSGVWSAILFLVFQTIFVYVVMGLLIMKVSLKYVPPTPVILSRYVTYMGYLLASFSPKRILPIITQFSFKSMSPLQNTFKNMRKPFPQSTTSGEYQKVTRFQNTVAIPMLAGMVVAACLFLLPLLASAQIVEPGFESEVVTDGLSLATTLAFTPDGRILVAEKSGVIKLVKNGVLQPQPVVTLSDVNTFGDRGLIGLAVDPNFAQNGYIYVSYTYENSPGVNIGGTKTGRIVRMTMVGDTAEESSKFVLVGTVGGSVASSSCEDFVVTADCIASDSNSHSVGGLRFGPDGFLYASLGDGADFSAVDPRALRAQNVDALAGKILRIRTDGTAPASNPFYNGDPNSNRSKVYALGVRNSFRFNFNSATGQLYAGDVGWSNWEEVNRIVSGANYGWPCREGLVATSYGCTPSSTPTNPLYVYAHNSTGAGSITAGSFFSNGVYPASYATSMFIGDYAQQWMKRLVLSADGASMVSVQNFNSDIFPVDIITGPDGTIYYIDIVFGTLNRLTHTSGNRRPVVNLNANPTSGLAPLTVNFSSAGTNDPDGNPITFAWTFGDGASSTLANPSHTYTTIGSRLASLTVRDSLGSATSKNTTILVGNQAPTARIVSPVSGSLYTVGSTITVNGEATDPETGVLPPSAFSWTVILHHNVHTHTIYQQTGTSTITFPADDHSDPDVYIEVRLRVTDSAGLVDTESINMYLNNGSGSGNLISNPSVETEGTIATAPLNWFEGWYGVMDPVFTYPVAGLAGSRAVKIDVLSHTSGDAKWYFSPAFVTAGSQYTFSNIYTATVPTTLTAQFGRPDGTYEYLFLGSVPATATPTRISYTFTIPAGIETATVFHQLGTVGSLVTDDFTLALAGADVIPPTGVIASPVANATLSGLVSVDVTANDDEGVASVALLVNGTLTGVGDSEPAYSVSWDTTSVVDGDYAITARITDTSGNTFETPAVQVEVDNNNSTPTNLIQNGNFEQGTANAPLGWQPGGWGTQTSVFSYPVAGATGGSAAQVQITKYNFGDTGDAKWQHVPVPVTAGTEYTYRTSYKATSISDVIGRYTFTDGSVHYFGLIKEIPGTPNWTNLEKSFVPPVGAETVTLLHLISSVATLTIDDVALFATGTGTPSETNPPTIDFVSPTPGAVLSGTVTLTATSSDASGVVGVYFALNGAPFGGEDQTAPYQYIWNTTSVPDGTYVLKATTHDIYGNNDKKEITVTVNNSNPPPPVATSTNLVVNGNLETAGTVGNPANWNRGGWGTNTRTYTYPATGVTGNGAAVTISGYVSGDAKWFFNDVAVTPGTQYNVSNRYNSTVGSEALIRYTLTGGATSYQFLSALPATGGTWATLNRTFTPPVNTVSMTLFHLIAGNGTLTIDDVSVMGPAGTTTGTTTDTIAPLVSVTSPATGATVSGVVAITASSSDASGVASVTLLVDGTTVGTADTTAPYTFTWNSASSTNGAHTISARSVDTRGNVATATPITVTVNNVTTPPPTGTSTNLVQNGNLETVGTVGNPAQWNRGGWGTNTRTYTYPATGISGNGAMVTISGYVSGDAKWFFNDVAVTPGTQYTVSNRYNSTVGSEALIRYTLTGGTTQYLFLNALPATGGTWATLNRTVTPPANTVSMTLFHLIAGNGSLTIDDISVTGPAGTTTGTTTDTTAPTVSITSPSTGATASGTVAITAQASDASGVASVSLIIDGAVSGAADTTAPYTFTWNSASSSNGSHTISARATDTRGNVATATPITVTVNNATTTPPPPPIATSANLIQNGNLETAGTAGNPANYNRGGWGTNNRTFTYPVTGASGNGAEVAITTYTSGDAKWYFTPVMVNPGEQYTFSYAYKASVPTNITLKYTRTDGTSLYVGVAAPVASATWTTGTFSFVPPAGVTDVTVMHILTGIGSLSIDNQQLTSGNTNSFNRGMVSFSFDDGWVEHATIAQPTLDELDIDGTFYIITDYSIDATEEQVLNPNLETAGTVGNPANWNRGGWGTNDRIYTYPVTGTSGNAAEITIANYTSGDAKWFFDPIDVSPTITYTVSDVYRSNATTEVVVQYTRTDGTFQYQFLQSLPATGEAWQTFSREITVPDGVTKLTVFHILASVGTLAIDATSVKPAQVYVNKDQILSMQTSGHEIGGHTRSHPMLTTLTTAEKTDEINGSRQALLSNGVNSVTSMAYPYGDFDSSVQTIAQNSGYTSARSVLRGYNDTNTNPYALVIQQVSRDDTVAELRSWVDQAAASNTWVIFMFHQISNATNDTLGITPADFINVANYTKTANVDIVTVSEGAAFLQ